MKEASRTSCVFGMAAVLASGLCICQAQMAAAANVQHHPAPAAPVMFSVGPQTAVGAVPAQGGTQFSAQGGTVYGTFGSRTLGQSFVPSPSTFGGGIQTSPTGSFLYAGRTDGSAALATPWRQFNAGAAGAAAQPAYGTAGPQSPAPEEFGGPATDEMNAWPMNAGEGLSALEQVLGMTAGLEPPAALRMAPQAAVARPQPYARSPELSALMTRIAQFQEHARQPGDRRLRQQQRRSFAGRRSHARRRRPAGERPGPGAASVADRQPVGGGRVRHTGLEVRGCLDLNGPLSGWSGSSGGPLNSKGEAFAAGCRSLPSRPRSTTACLV